uniref:Glutaredoxin domain-containing protein n=1 Tax=Panagrellus redivivus TaxID=6233 RepID=A0A7E4WBU8_PANRE
MPFPLHALPYGLRRRLHELTTPIERYHLQIAGGDAPLYVCPPRLQPVRKITPVWRLSHDGKNLMAHYDKATYHNPDDITFDRHDLIACTGLVVIDNVMLDQLSSGPLLNHLLIRPMTLVFKVGDCSDAFVNAISKITDKSPRCIIVTSCSSAVSMCSVLTAFRRLRVLKVFKTPIADMEALFKKGKTRLSCLFIDNTAEEFKKIAVATVVKFLIAQKNGFCLAMIINGSTIEATESLKKHLNVEFPPLIRVEGKSEQMRYVKVESNGIIETFCLPLSKARLPLMRKPRTYRLSL